MKTFEVWQMVFVVPPFGDGEAEQVDVVRVSPKGQTVTVKTAMGHERTYRQADFHRLLSSAEHEERKVKLAEARAVKAAEARLMAALREFGFAAWAVAQPHGKHAPGNVAAIDAATARVAAFTAALKEKP